MTIAARTIPLLLCFSSFAGTGAAAKAPDHHDVVTTGDDCWSTTARVYTKTKGGKTETVRTDVLQRTYSAACGDRKIETERRKSEAAVNAEKIKAEAALKNAQLAAASKLLTDIVRSDMPADVKKRTFAEIAARLASDEAGVRKSQTEAIESAGLSAEFIKNQLKPAAPEAKVTCKMTAAENGKMVFVCN